MLNSSRKSKIVFYTPLYVKDCSRHISVLYCVMFKLSYKDHHDFVVTNSGPKRRLLSIMDHGRDRNKS